MRIDIDEALAEFFGDVETFFASRVLPGVPLYSGGLLDAWPARVVDVLAVCGPEFSVINAFLSEAKHG